MFFSVFLLFLLCLIASVVFDSSALDFLVIWMFPALLFSLVAWRICGWFSVSKPKRTWMVLALLAGVSIIVSTGTTF